MLTRSQELETDTFRLYCSQTLTGVKFLVVADPKQAGVDQLLDKVRKPQYCYSRFFL